MWWPGSGVILDASISDLNYLVTKVLIICYTDNYWPGKLDIKRREPGILFISLPIVEHSSN